MRGAGCIQNVESKSKSLSGVAVPVRGTGCIYQSRANEKGEYVAFPVRGTGCIDNGTVIEPEFKAKLLSP